MEIISTFWPYLERAGMVSAVIMLWQLIKAEKELSTERERNETQRSAAQTALEQLQEKRVTDMRAMTELVERSTASLNAQSLLLKSLLDQR
jgi:hypothetical protein